MQLRDLEPKFLKRESKKSFAVSDDLTSADGIIFKCPKCFAENGGAVGTHSIICWKPHIPQTISPQPGRWNFEGTGYDDLTLVAGSS